MKKAIIVSVAAALLSIAAPSVVAGVAHAQEAAAQSQAAVTPERGQALYTTAGQRIGRITRVDDDGTVRVRVDMFVSYPPAAVPISTLSMQGDRLVTSLSSGQILALSRNR